MRSIPIYIIILVSTLNSCNCGDMEENKKNKARTVWATKERTEYYDSIINPKSKKIVEAFRERNKNNTIKMEGTFGSINKPDDSDKK